MCMYYVNVAGEAGEFIVETEQGSLTLTGFIL